MIDRYQELKGFGLQEFDFSNIPPGRLKNLARHAGVVSMHKIARMPYDKKIATLVAFVKANVRSSACSWYPIMKDKKLFQKIKNNLKTLYGDRLKEVILYGSEARGQAGSYSDIDILVLLHGPIDCGRQIRPIIDALYDIQLETEPFRPISAIAVDEEDFNQQEFALFRKVHKT